MQFLGQELAVIQVQQGLELGDTLRLMVSLGCKSLSVCRPRGACSSGRMGCLLVTGWFGSDHCGGCFFPRFFVGLSG